VMLVLLYTVVQSSVPSESALYSVDYTTFHYIKFSGGHTTSNYLRLQQPFTFMSKTYPKNSKLYFINPNFYGMGLNFLPNVDNGRDCQSPTEAPIFSGHNQMIGINVAYLFDIGRYYPLSPLIKVMFFSSCPRTSSSSGKSCTVVSWSNIYPAYTHSRDRQQYTNNEHYTIESLEAQAVLYHQSGDIVLQYLDAAHMPFSIALINTKSPKSQAKAFCEFNSTESYPTDESNFHTLQLDDRAIRFSIRAKSSTSTTGHPNRS